MNPLTEAFAFASQRHEGQYRKDGKTPYIAHPARVALTVRHVFGVEDERCLIAAVLHDTMEDTKTDYEDLERRFGREITDWVGMLSDDKRLPEDARETEYHRVLAAAPPEVQLVKLADIYDNYLDAENLLPERMRKHREKAQREIQVFMASQDTRVRRAIEVLTELFRTNP
jgi:GTP diphosphokinase / guanosine-3',5'-bis(diphosphate) 3'-diphosphatase